MKLWHVCIREWETRGYFVLAKTSEIAMKLAANELAKESWRDIKKLQKPVMLVDDFTKQWISEEIVC